jgi:uncharacterized protein (DUF2267 family)
MPAEHDREMTDFVNTVRRDAKLEKYEEAEQLSRASLEALGQSISGGQAKQLAQWLPKQLQPELAEQHGQASAFDKAQFIDKVGGKIYSVDSDEVERQVGVVLATARAAAPSGEVDDTLAQLPPELSALFNTGHGPGGA